MGAGHGPTIPTGGHRTQAWNSCKQVRLFRSFGAGQTVRAQTLQLAHLRFDEMRTKQKKKVYKLSSRSVRRVEDSVAHILLRLQSIFLARIQLVVSWACSHWMFDETGEKLVVNANFLPQAKGAESKWEVMVIRLVCLWGDDYGNCQRFIFNIPPMPLSSTSAAALWAALMKHDVPNLAFRVLQLRASEKCSGQCVAGLLYGREGDVHSCLNAFRFRIC